MSSTVLGIDISKLNFDAILLEADGKPHHKARANNADSVERLQAWLEATGTYAEA